MERKKLIAKFVEIASEKMGKDLETVDEENTFKELGFDSIDVIDLVMFFEDEFALRIEDEEISKIRKVKDLIDIVIKKLEEIDDEVSEG
ncbi:acyl carrier protein [Thermotoga maritima MSB8]|uniref:Acyl carrier protein n=1 Tax=Thermotoga maritima (strain ATCC 43589 / DSM 3109 / JCM 10099 / NBRC 100826 / MSB8) TaxID=243274 RepID=Q9WY19_THEMA|nr:phosphopantetheine-binding protein [Thermotoga maritima]AAD35268.1 acyl carrier protein [Thermotoga maritima MSB8]AGL49099.1 Acyl carrier protein [Thermotoga maritima MSB8]AHD18058.1 acyl carrier protein [Thermotoga maritima MSB8]AKE26117.1 acyl carrier protein [Thermotoga maritima]AKE27980.1 acyl carrier protein [Thermotoga maritima MSB8]